MTDDKSAQKQLLRVVDIFKAKPAAALSTITGKATVAEGLTCEFVQGDDKAVLDMSPTIGGGGKGPSPGFYGRAGIAGCVAIGIKMTALRLGADLKDVAVNIEQDFDDRGVLGFDDAPAAAITTRIAVEITSSEQESVLRDIVDLTLKADPWFLSFRDAQPVELNVTIT